MSNNTYERYQLINHVKKLIIFDGREIVRCQCQQKKLQGEGTTTIVYNVENRFKISLKHVQRCTFNAPNSGGADI